MKLKESKYSQFELCHEIFETIDIVANFKQDISKEFIPVIKSLKKIFLTGEGSSRVFPAKHFRCQSLLSGAEYYILIEGALQAMEYELDNYIIFGVSNSGKTSEVMQLFSHLKEKNHRRYFGVTATPGSPIATMPQKSVILTCGKENAIPATKSVVEEAMFFESLIYNYSGIKMPDLKQLSRNIRETLELPIDLKIIDSVCNAPIIYFSARNDGVAEELAIKSNELTRKKSVFLEATLAIHGTVEVMNKGDIVIIIEPFQQEEQKFYQILVEDIGVEVIAIASRDTIFPTIKIPDAGNYHNYIELVAGWNVLTEVGINLGNNLDKTVRLKKVMNEGYIM